MKTYKIIQVGGMLLAVDEKCENKQGDGWYCPHNNCYGVATKQGVGYMINNDDHWKIVAYNPLSTGKTLEGLPLLPSLTKSVENIAVDCFEELKKLNPQGGLKEFVRMAVNYGYKSAGGYTANKIQDAIWEGIQIAKKNYETGHGFDDNQIEADVFSYLNSINKTKYPTSVEVDESLPVDQQLKQGKYVWEG